MHIGKDLSSLLSINKYSNGLRTLILSNARFERVARPLSVSSFQLNITLSLFIQEVN